MASAAALVATVASRRSAEDIQAAHERTLVGNCAVCLEDDVACITVHGSHSFCHVCVTAHFEAAVAAGDLPLRCLECDEDVDMELVQLLFKGTALMDAHDRLLLLRTLQRNPLVRFCPAPDCCYAVECHATQRECPRLHCPVCSSNFCFVCRESWHPGQPCKDWESTTIKPCPECGVAIFKEQDGSCNQMSCSVCRTEFCWLCLKKMSTLSGINHFTSMSGCTMFGARRWSARKTQLWRMTAPITAPLVLAGIGTLFALALVAVPAVMVRDDIRSKTQWGRKRRALYAGLSMIGTVAVTSPFLVIAMVGMTLKVLNLAYIVFPYKLIKSAFVSKRRQRMRRTAEGVVDASQDVLEMSDPDDSGASEQQTTV